MIETPFGCCEFSNFIDTTLAVFDFYGRVLALEFAPGTTSAPSSAELSISVYNDGVPEGEEGFAIVLYVAEGELDARDVGFVNVEDSVAIIRLREGGNTHQVH